MDNKKTVEVHSWYPAAQREIDRLLLEGWEISEACHIPHHSCHNSIIGVSETILYELQRS